MVSWTWNGTLWVSNRRVTFGLIVRDGKVVESAPYGRKWCLGRQIDELRSWLTYRGYETIWLDDVDGPY